MLEYEWGNPSPVILAGGEESNSQVSDPTRIQIFDHYSHNFNEATFLNPNDFTQNHHQFLHAQSHFNSLYEPRAYGGEWTQYAPSPPPLQLEPVVGLSSEDQTGFMVMPKAEPVGCGIDFMASRIGLNLGGRTYFSSAEDDFVNRLYRRSRPFEAGLVNSPRCQAEGCNADLTHAKHYHRRHKVCEFHSKASTVIAAGLTQRFCQQCSRFHLLSEFDNGKRSCRKRLADHNRRRRKSSQQQAQAQAQPAHNTSQISTSNAMVSKNVVTRSPPDSAAQSSSSVTVAVSPTRISVDFLPRRSSSSASNSLVYF